MTTTFSPQLVDNSARNYPAPPVFERDLQASFWVSSLSPSAPAISKLVLTDDTPLFRWSESANDNTHNGQISVMKNILGGGVILGVLMMAIAVAANLILGVNPVSILFPIGATLVFLIALLSGKQNGGGASGNTRIIA